MVNSARDEFYNTALHIACQNNHVNIISELLQNQNHIANVCDTEITNMFGRTPLHEAARQGHEAAVRELFLNSAKVNIDAIVESNGWGALHFAATVNSNSHRNSSNHANANGLQLLIELGANMEQRTKDSRGSTSLHLACEKGNWEAVRILVHSGANVNVYDKQHCTPLHLACHKGDPQIVRVLLDGGSNIMAVTKGQKWSALHFACSSSSSTSLASLNVVKELLKHPSLRHSLSTSQTALKSTPLHHACYFGCLDIAQELICHGANLNARDANGNTPLMVALSGGNVKLTKELIHHGADIQARNLDGQTVLHIACSHSVNENEELNTLDVDVRLDVVQALLAQNANICALNEQQQTPLILAATSPSSIDNVNVIFELVRHDPNSVIEMVQ